MNAKNLRLLGIVDEYLINHDQEDDIEDLNNLYYSLHAKIKMIEIEWNNKRKNKKRAYQKLKKAFMDLDSDFEFEEVEGKEHFVLWNDPYTILITPLREGETKLKRLRYLMFMDIRLENLFFTIGLEEVQRDLNKQNKKKTQLRRDN